MHTVNNLSLRFLLRIIRVFVTLFFLIATAKAQNIDVVFAGNEEKILNEFGKEKIEDTYQKGIVGVKIDESNVKIFQKIAPRYIQLIYEQITSQSNLKKWMQKGMAISENSMNLTYILVDDTEGLEKDEESFFSVYESSVDKGKRYVWPSFGNELVDKKEDKYQGWIYIGEGSCKTMVEDLEMGEKSLSNLTLNQAIRAQFFGNPTSWPYIYKPRRGLLNMDYSPYRAEEPIYTLGTGIEEATGYFFNILYNKEERQQLGIFFRNNARKYAISEDNKLYKNGGWIPKGQNSFKFKGKHFYAFNWSELPADKMLHFPSTSLFLYTYFWKYAPDQDQALEMIIQTSNYMWKDFDKRNLIYATHHLAMQLENYAAHNGRPICQKAWRINLKYVALCFTRLFDSLWNE